MSLVQFQLVPHLNREAPVIQYITGALFLLLCGICLLERIKNPLKHRLISPCVAVSIRPYIALIIKSLGHSHVFSLLQVYTFGVHFFLIFSALLSDSTICNFIVCCISMSYKNEFSIIGIDGLGKIQITITPT